MVWISAAIKIGVKHFLVAFSLQLNPSLMFIIKAAAYAMLVLAFAAIYPQIVRADKFDGHKFLQWPNDSQHAFIETSVTMVGIVASQGRLEISQCIDDWYTGDEATQRQRSGYILDIIKENPSYHPQGVILAVLQKRCGSFKNEAD